MFAITSHARFSFRRLILSVWLCLWDWTCALLFTPLQSAKGPLPYYLLREQWLRMRHGAIRSGWLTPLSVNMAVETDGLLVLIIKMFLNSYRLEATNLFKAYVLKFLIWTNILLIGYQTLVQPMDRQWAQSPDLLLVNLEEQTDSFTLYIKGTILICERHPFRIYLVFAG